jgi:glycosyltransferase involved in cell wall biosynthesis
MSERPVVVYLGQLILPDGNAAALRARSNAKILGLLGYDTCVVGTHHDAGDRVDAVEAGHPDIQLHSVPVGRWWHSFRVNPLSSLRLINRLRQTRTVSHVICYNYPAVAQAIIQLYCAIRGIRYLSDVTEWNTESGRGFFHDTIRAVEVTARVRLLNRFANALITTSPMMTQFYRKPGRPTAELPTLFDAAQMPQISDRPARDPATVRIVFVGPGFDLMQVSPKPEALKERTDLIVATLCEMMVADPRVSADIYGLTSVQFAAAFPGHVGKVSALAGRLVFHGRQPHNAILSAVQSADYSIMLRDNKRANDAGFPTKFAESLILGTPVIIDRISSLRHYWDHPLALTIERDTPEAMAQAIMRGMDERRDLPPASEDERMTFNYDRFVDEMSKVFEARV